MSAPVFSSSGTFRYSPKSCGNRGSGKWWLVIDCCEDLCAFYRHLFNHEHRARSPKLCRPAWGSHITVVRDEQPPKIGLWETHAGEEVEFEFVPQVCGDGVYFWLNVGCERALDVRDEMGLSRQPEMALHLTVGRFDERVVR